MAVQTAPLNRKTNRHFTCHKREESLWEGKGQVASCLCCMTSALQGKSHLIIPFLGIARPQSQFAHSCVCERFKCSQDWSPYFPDRSWKYINLSQIYKCRKWETEHYNSVLEIIISFLGIQKWEPNIYIGCSPALHLQCGFFTACHYTDIDAMAILVNILSILINLIQRSYRP